MKLNNLLSKPEKVSQFHFEMLIKILIQCGLYYKYFDQIKMNFLSVYGHQSVFLWRDLEKLNVIHKETKEYSYEYLCEKFKLIFETIDLNSYI